MNAQLLTGRNKFSLNGECPHCLAASVFAPVQDPYLDERNWVTPLQCQGCLKFILGIATSPSHNGTGKCDYVAHFPLGKPNDSVPSEVPEEIAEDFREALRCRWLDALKATVTMCRRSLQGSCTELGAKGSSLVAQIEGLAKQGKITEPMRQMAHAVRLEGNKGAHPDDLQNVTPDDADAVIAFTKEFFHHVYVMPAKLTKYLPAKNPTP